MIIFQFAFCSLSSVVEHHLDTVGATGSNPVGCTIFSSDSSLNCIDEFCFGMA